MISDHDFSERLRTAGVSTWGLADLLGVHPHLVGGLTPKSLMHLPVSTVLVVARILGLRADELLATLDPALHPKPPARASLDRDALTVLTALHTTASTLTADDLADVLAWTLGRTQTALDHAGAAHHLAGPVTLRRVPPAGYRVTTRQDLVTAAQHHAIQTRALYHHPLTEDEAAALLAVMVLRHRAIDPAATYRPPTYPEWREDHTATEADLLTLGLTRVRHNRRPDHLELSPDVAYSLRLAE